MTKDSEHQTPPPPPPPPSTEYHPALSVNNIKNVIPLILDREKVQYSNWVELFEVHCHAFNVLDHIDSTVPRRSDVSDSLWRRLDSIVKQWIYGTITLDLLQSVLCKGDSAQQFWNKLKDLFQDNKNTRAVYLENQFNSLHLSNFSNISTYCRQLKSLKDQLAAVDQPVTEQKLVIRLVSGLINTDYDTVATIIQQTEPLPSSEIARSRLLLEETCRSNDQGSQSASFVAQSLTPTSATNSTPAPPAS
ncbi:uncharacterized protein LOC110685711 [Chenopodium quinoa]|uniref:uncharacterized protein LOC110685711 n=1 Tax=Chenopodium quinoa TaxID=63459 RepID=UPI000B78E13E|nr:uncharacterized protein LOC110685711 [Chenopodium quinoa]